MLVVNRRTEWMEGKQPTPLAGVAVVVVTYSIVGKKLRGFRHLLRRLK